jgi:pimeloyl-ACP methyl ester carboxylesterase
MTRLILIPGLAGDATMWRAQLQDLTDWQPQVTDVHMRHPTIESMAAALLAEHAGPLVLCGASMGGMIAMEAARQAPSRIAGLALLGTSAKPESEEMRKVREAAIALFAQGRSAEVIEPNVALAFHPERAQDAALAKDYVDFVLRAGDDQLIAQNRAVMARPDARVHLPALRCPTLVLCGDSDQLSPQANSMEIAALIPGARLQRIARCGHMLTMERPREVNAALREWLDSLPG